MRNGNSNGYQNESVDRLPPYSSEAEQGLLGCVMLDPQEVLPACIERFTEGGMEFYDLRHQNIYQTMVELWDDQDPIDVITLSERLKVWEKLEQVGGMAYVATLADATPSAANFASYLQIILEKFWLRKMLRVCTEVVGRIYSCEADVATTLDEAERDVLRAAESRLGHNSASTLELVHQAIINIEQRQHNGNQITGIATGFADFDWITKGLHGGRMYVIGARPSMGKAQPLSAKLLTPAGFTTMGAIAIGDMVVGSSGSAVPVTGIFPQGRCKVYRVTMSDGTSTRCTGDHLWFTQTRNERRRKSSGSVKSLDRILATIKRQDSDSPNHAIPIFPIVHWERVGVLPINPWLLGALLGDGKLKNGNIMFSKPESDVLDRVLRELPPEDTGSVDGMDIRIKRKHKNNEPSETAKAISALGLRVHSEQKFIPDVYLKAPAECRMELLRGLLDTDGYVIGPAVEFSTSSEQLAMDVSFLVRSLGGICSCADPRDPTYSYKGERRIGQKNFRMVIWFQSPEIIPVSSLKSLAFFRPEARHVHRSIVSIEEDGWEDCQCIQVASNDGIYITDDFIPTHNTSLALNIADYVAVNLHLPVGIFSLEMTGQDLIERMIASRSRVNLAREFRDSDYPKVTNAAAQIAHAPIFIDDTSGLSILQIRAKARRLWQQHGVKLFLIDYLQLANAIGGARKHENRQQEISDISNGLKSMSKDLNVPVIVLAQLNRDIEREKNRRPRLSDLRESGATEQDADLVGLLYRPGEYGDDEESEAYKMDLLIAKNRHGPTGTVPLTFLRAYTRFESAAKVTDEDVPQPQQEMQYAP